MKILKSRPELFVLDMGELVMLVKHVVAANSKKRLLTKATYQLIQEWLISK